jgi:hypothetical protein
MKRIALSVVLAVTAGLFLAAAASAQSTVSISSNFNGTPIPPGSYVWFNSHLNVSGINANQTTTVTVTNATLDIEGQVFGIPSARITFSPGAGTPSTLYNAATNTWETNVPASLGGNTFMTGFPIFFPNGLAGGQNPVILTATFNSDHCGVSGSFQWGAAVYTRMPTDLNDLGVKVADNYGSSHHAGSPENFTQYVIGGARGGGGSNFTGSWSATGHFECGCGPPPTPTPTPTPTPGITCTPTPTPTPTPPEMTPTPTPPMMTPTPTPPTVPEPATIILFGSGLMALGAKTARRYLGRKKKEDADEESE